MLTEFQKKVLALQVPLTADDIDMRINTITEYKGFSLLLYKTSRADVKRLNKVFGTHWKNDFHYDEKGNLHCTISIYDEQNNIWIPRDDVGTESYAEKEKGSHSDAFKRSGFRWGIGIELYDVGFIWIKWSEKDGWYKNNKGKAMPKAYPNSWKLTIKDGIFEIHDNQGNFKFSNRSKGNTYTKGNTHTQDNTQPPKNTAPPANNNTDDDSKSKSKTTLAEVKNIITNLKNTLITNDVYTEEMHKDVCQSQVNRVDHTLCTAADVPGLRNIYSQLQQLSNNYLATLNNPANQQETHEDPGLPDDGGKLDKPKEFDYKFKKGKHSGETYGNVDMGYLKWMIEQGYDSKGYYEKVYNYRLENDLT